MQEFRKILGEVKALTPDDPKEKRNYADAIMAFDIETSRLSDDNSVMYIWQCALKAGDEIAVQYGRTWEEWEAMTQEISAALHGMTIVCFVHNLSYEFQFLAGIFQFSDVKCLKERKILSATCGNIEYRCSYIWTNKTLAKFLAEMGVDHQKKSGADFDYTKIRYPWTPLTPDEIEYCQNDVVGLAEAADKKMSHDGDTLYTVPRTSTGYVRRDAKQALSGYALGNIKPTLEVYYKLRRAFRGGNTHANRYFVGKVLKGVQSVDRSSSYPDVMLNQKFPMTTFKKQPDGFATVRRLLHAGMAILCTLTIAGCHLCNEAWGEPYIPVAKCTQLKEVIEDNGRVLSAGMLTIECTEIDIGIIMEQYEGDYDFTDIYSAQKDYLPEKFRDTIRKYYTQKTSLKGVAGEEYQYAKSKALLNALYGMCATDPGKPDVDFDGMEYVKEDPDIAKNIKKSFLPYQWGVWVTAYARQELEEMIKIAGNNFVYADTDSCKFIKDENISFDEYNARCKANSEANKATAIDPKGKMHYMGVAEYEGEYCKFIAWGAKKYASEDENGKISITIAGVRKKSSRNSAGEIVEMGGADELMQAGGLSEFAPGFTFRKAGGLESVYNDMTDYTTIIDGHTLHVTRNVCLRPSTYRVGITEKYRTLIEGLPMPYVSIDTDRYLCYNLIKRNDR